jgi:hypothetical protein
MHRKSRRSLGPTTSPAAVGANARSKKRKPDQAQINPMRFFKLALPPPGLKVE